MDISKSVLQKLRSKSRNEELSFQLVLQLFCQEEFLRRLSYSQYQDNLILKGGLFLYLITNFESRPTMDIDFLMKNLSNENEKITKVIQEIINIETENPYITFKIRAVTPIAEQSKYEGVRIKMIGNISNTRTPFDIDIGLGDIVIPKPSIKKLEVQLKGFDKPEVLTYSLESAISEKWDAIIDRMELNSRMKDFYDIYYLAEKFSFEGRDLKKAVFKTLANRERICDETTLQKVKQLKDDKDLVKRWDLFAKNTLALDLAFDQVMESVLAFISQPFESIVNDEDFNLKWDKVNGKWY